MMIYFGTGRYLANSDIIDTSVQSFYGITDGGTRLVGSRNIILQQQSIDTETSVSLNGNNYDIRTTSDTAVGSLNGWYMDLVSPVNGQEGERVVQTPVLRNNRIIFPTLIPAAGVCGLGGSSWLMELDAFNGGRLSTSPFDLDQDGVFDNYVSTGGGSTTNTPLSGTRHNEVISSPGILNADGKEFKYTSGSSGNVSVTVESPDPSAFNRQSWRQLR
jgi:type IV pilus assembly protein PilY1